LAEAQRDAADRLGRLYFDLALTSGDHALAALSTLAPPDHWLFGTDYPMAQEIGVHLTATVLDRWPGLTADERDAVRGTNPMRLLPRFDRRVSPVPRRSPA